MCVHFCCCAESVIVLSLLCSKQIFGFLCGNCCGLLFLTAEIHRFIARFSQKAIVWLLWFFGMCCICWNTQPNTQITLAKYFKWPGEAFLVNSAVNEPDFGITEILNSDFRMTNEANAMKTNKTIEKRRNPHIFWMNDDRICHFEPNREIKGNKQL